MKSKIYLNFLFIFTFIYFLLTIIGFLYSPKKEFFPFFHWALYESVPQEEIIKYDILFGKKQNSFFNSKQQIHQKQKVFMLNSLGNCQSIKCKKKYSKVISKFIKTDICAVFVSINSSKKIDTLGYIYNSSFNLKSCNNESRNN